jgi:exosome complex RNA-binding protein Csl4
MTRTEAIAKIAAHLSSLDDARVFTVAELVDDIASTQQAMRGLSASEQALIERSKEDFRLGRVVTAQAYRVQMDAFFATRRAKLG